jgi:hypothetical protein
VLCEQIDAMVLLIQIFILPARLIVARSGLIRTYGLTMVPSAVSLADQSVQIRVEICMWATHQDLTLRPGYTFTLSDQPIMVKPGQSLQYGLMMDELLITDVFHFKLLPLVYMRSGG